MVRALLRKAKRTIRILLDETGEKDFSKLTGRLEKYEYVSFDVFDTLIKRDVYRPVEVFSVMEKLTGLKGFAAKRIEAEQAAREKYGGEDVSLEQIYSCLDTDRDRGRLAEKERELELNLCTANRDILPVYRHCLEKGRKVLIISDMYLDTETVEKILEKNGFGGYHKLYISNAEGKAKYSGSLYRLVRSEIGESASAVHIGNSFKGDLLMAKRNGFDAIKIKTTIRRTDNSAGSKRSLTADVRDLECFVNNHTLRENFYDDFGYEKFGPALAGFAGWLLEKMKEQNREAVLFIGRDGYIMKQVYDILGYDKIIPSEYIEVSRRSLRVPYLADKEGFDVIFPLQPLKKYASVREFLDCLGLDADKYRDVIADLGLDADKQRWIFDFKDDKAVRELYEILKDDIREKAAAEKESLCAYLSRFGLDRRIALADVGWGGTIQKYMDDLMRELGKPADFLGYYWGLAVVSRKKLLSDGRAKASGYIFDCLGGGWDHDYHTPFVGFFETLFLQRVGSVESYSANGGDIVINRLPYEYENETESFETVTKIQQSALRFAEDFSSSVLRDTVSNDADTMFRFLRRSCTDPTAEEMRRFCDIKFYDSGKMVKLIDRKSFMHCLLHPKDFFVSYLASFWRAAYLKSIFRIKLPYMFIAAKLIPAVRRKIFKIGDEI